MLININSQDIEQNIRHLNKTLKVLEKEGDRAIQSVLNRGITSIRKTAVRNAAKSIGIPQKSLKKRYSYRRAKPSNLRIIISARTRPINAVPAGAKQTDEGLTLGPYNWEGGFIVKSEYGRSVGVQRVGKKRYPLKPAQFGKQLVYREMKDTLYAARDRFIKSQYDKELEKEIKKRHRRVIARSKK